jgi:hypothetical protein
LKAARGIASDAVAIRPEDLEQLLRVSLRERELNPRPDQLRRKDEPWESTRGGVVYTGDWQQFEPAFLYSDPQLRAEALRCIAEIEDWPDPQAWPLAEARIKLMLADPDEYVRGVAQAVLNMNSLDYY